MSKAWLYGVIALLAVALAFETGYLVRAKTAKPEPGGYPARAVASARRAPAASASPYSWNVSRTLPSYDEWDPFREMDELRREMDRLFQDNLNRRSRLGASEIGAYDPNLDFQETPGAYLVRLDLPGIEKDKIDVKVQNGMLLISGRREAEKTENGRDGGFYRMERSFGSFARTVPLPPDAASEGMTAETVNGVLTVKIPRVSAEKAAKAQKVDVR